MKPLLSGEPVALVASAFAEQYASVRALEQPKPYRPLSRLPVVPNQPIVPPYRRL